MNKPVFYIIFFLTLFTSLKGSAQENLVYNGSFEEYYSCPESNDLGDGQLERCKGWWKPTSGTSDYFNRCANMIIDIPNNFWGYQETFQGNGYVGLVPICWDTITKELCGLEYIQTKLIRQLTPCNKYHLSFYVSCADKSYYAIGKLGAYFGDSLIHNLNDFVLDYTPQVQNQGIISDTVNWVKIEGSFVASGNEAYLTIGYFSTDLTNDTLYIQPSFSSSVAAYYYIDSVSLIEIGEADGCDIPVPNIFTPNNDGLNDHIDFGYLNGFEDLDFRILNRWGNCVYVYDKDNPIWYGTINDGQPCTDGVYFYCLNSKTFRKTGFIQLIR